MVAEVVALLESALSQPVSQERFGELVGITQQAVSDLAGRGVLQPGQNAHTWLLAYTKHLREQAAGRSADGELANQRARLAREQADRVAMENAQARRELAPVALLELVLGKLAGDVASVLNGVVPRIRRQAPDLPAHVVRLIEAELVKVRELAAAVSLHDAEDRDDEEEPA